MFAVIQTGGKQFTVSEGDTIRVEKLDTPVGESVTLNQVMMVGEGEQVQVGAPMLEGCTVNGEVTRQFKDKKIIVFKKKRRKGYRRKNGHRQFITELKITGIQTK